MKFGTAHKFNHEKSNTVKVEAYLRIHAANETEFVGAWIPGRGERELSADELWTGEVTAVVFRVGCYTVRSAQRVDGTHDISARHDGEPEGSFIHVCDACSGKQGGIEYIGDIFAVKDNADVPDECASLLVYKHFESRASGRDTWYQLNPDGKVIKTDDGI